MSTPGHARAAADRAAGSASTTRPSGRPLDARTRDEMESRFGADFSSVRVHTDAGAQLSAYALGAKAYTVGRDIAFGEGRYAPESSDGRRLLAHELAHVLQQARGGQTPTVEAPSAALEHGAETAATQVMSGSGAVAVSGASGVGVARDKDADPQKPTYMQSQLDDALQVLAKGKKTCQPAHHQNVDFGSMPPLTGYFDAPAAQANPPASANAHSTPTGYGSLKPRSDAAATPPGKSPQAIPPVVLQFINTPPAKEDSGAHRPFKIVSSPEMYLDPLKDRPTAERELREKYEFLKRLAPGAEKILEADPNYFRAMGKYAPTPEERKAEGVAVPKADAGVMAPIQFDFNLLPKNSRKGFGIDSPAYWQTARGKFRSNLRGDISATRNALESLEGQRKAVVDNAVVARKVAESMAGGIEPPPMKDLYDGYELLAKADAALVTDDVEGAQVLYSKAAALRYKISWEWGHYFGFLEMGLNQEIEQLGNVRDASKYTLMALSLGSGAGVAAVGMIGSVAIDGTEAVTDQALGKPVDWTKMGVEIAVQAVMMRFGGPLASKLIGRIVTRPGFAGVTTRLIANALANGAVVRAASATFAKLRQARKPGETWGDLVGEIAGATFDPGSMAMDVLLGVISHNLAGGQGAPTGAGPGEPHASGPPPVESHVAGNPGSGGGSPANPGAQTTKVVPIESAKGRSGPAVQLKGPPGLVDAIPIGRARTKPPVVPQREPASALVPAQQEIKATGTDPVTVGGTGVTPSAHEAAVASSGGERKPPDLRVAQKGNGIDTPAGGERKGPGRIQPPGASAEPKGMTELPEGMAQPAANDTKLPTPVELGAMDKTQRRKWVKALYPEATNTDWIKAPATIQANQSGTIFIHAEPGMIVNDARRKASALDAHAQQGQASKVATPEARSNVPHPFDPTLPPVPKSSAHRWQLVEQIHKQAAAQDWDEKRKFDAVARALRVEGDHVLDLQLGGGDHGNNIWALDAYTNERLGAQIAAQLRNMPVGTKITKVVLLP